MIGWCLLLGGVTILAWQGLQYSEGRQQLTAAQERLKAAAFQAGAAQANPAGPRAPAEARQLLVYLATPWEPLLSLFESHAAADVVLQRFEPDAAGGTLEVGGRANSFSALTRYLTALEADRRLSSVILRHHHTAEGGDGSAIDFNLVARWGSALGQDPRKASSQAAAGGRR